MIILDDYILLAASSKTKPSSGKLSLIETNKEISSVKINLLCAK